MSPKETLITRRALPILAITGLTVGVVHAATPEFTLTMRADRTVIAVGETVTWTVSITGDYTGLGYIKGYDLSFIANDGTLGVASGFVDNLNPILGPTPGTANGASLLGTSGGQSTILGNVDTDERVIGTFGVLATRAGELTYTIGDGGMYATFDQLYIDEACTDCWWLLLGPPTYTSIDTVTIVPAPAVLPIFGAFGCCMVRQRGARS